MPGQSISVGFCKPDLTLIRKDDEAILKAVVGEAGDGVRSRQCRAVHVGQADPGGIESRFDTGGGQRLLTGDFGNRLACRPRNGCRIVWRETAAAATASSTASRANGNSAEDEQSITEIVKAVVVAILPIGAGAGRPSRRCYGEGRVD